MPATSLLLVTAGVRQNQYILVVLLWMMASILSSECFQKGLIWSHMRVAVLAQVVLYAPDLSRCGMDTQGSGLPLG